MAENSSPAGPGPGYSTYMTGEVVSVSSQHP